MKEPEFIKIDTALVDGMKDRVERRHNDGESYAEMYAENSEKFAAFDVDVDMDSISFQRVVAFDIAITTVIADEYMRLHGWEFDYNSGKWVRRAPVPNNGQSEDKE